MHLAIIFNNKKSDKPINEVNQQISLIWKRSKVSA